MLLATTIGIAVIAKFGAIAVTPKSPQQFWFWSRGGSAAWKMLMIGVIGRMMVARHYVDFVQAVSRGTGRRRA